MADQYDAFDTDERPRSTYMSRKDWKIALIALVVMGVILAPIYKMMKRNSENHLCVQNFQQMKNAMFVYMASNNDRFPPAFVEDAEKQPMAFDAGSVKAPYTWMSLIHGGMERRSSFVCPSALEDEGVDNLHPDRVDASFKSTYGLYLPWAGWPQSMMQNPDMAVLIAETSNKGANGTFNPLPYKGNYDGFAIGWDDGNTKISPASKFVTRLAFHETSKGKFGASGPARHDQGINVLFASGRKGLLSSQEAAIGRLGEQAVGHWADR